MFSSLLYNKLDVSGGWLRSIQWVWIWLMTFKALSMLFVLMTSLSLSAVLSCHTCSTSSRLCVLACFRFVCVPISVTSQCLWAMPFHYLWWQSSVVHDHMRAQTPTHTCYLLLTGEIVWRAFKAISALSRSFSSIHTLH